MKFWIIGITRDSRRVSQQMVDRHVRAAWEVWQVLIQRVVDRDLACLDKLQDCGGCELLCD